MKRRLRTDRTILLDTDFVSSFAWVNRMDIIEGLYSGRMMVLKEVMVVQLSPPGGSMFLVNHINAPGESHLCFRV